MNTVKLRGVVLGEGRPKICVPLTGASRKELLAEIAAVKTTKADLVEWRVDYFTEVMDTTRVLETLAALRAALGDFPLLFTFRTAREGGEKAIDTESYVALNSAVAAGKNADAVDVELFEGDVAVTRVVESAHQNGVAVVVSSHDFSRTPGREELVARLAKMRALGGDVPKVAVMPERFADVLELMAATDEYVRSADCPVITMSMNKLGCISRVAGQYYGSSLTFGSVTKASAPGQLAVGDLSAVLDILG